MSNERKVYPIEIAGVKRDLVLFQIKPGLSIAISKYPGGYRAGAGLRKGAQR